MTTVPNIANTEFATIFTANNRLYSQTTGSNITEYRVVVLSEGRNRFINGAFSVNQRNVISLNVSLNVNTTLATIAIANNPGYIIDRWYANATGGNASVQLVPGFAPAKYSIQLTGSANNTSTVLGQRIAVEEIDDLNGGNVTVSASVNSSSNIVGTWNAYVANSANSFSTKILIATQNVNINIATSRPSWTFNSGNANNLGLAVEFTTGPLAVAQTLTYGDLQLEIGDDVSPFDRRRYSTELYKCQYYFLRKNSTGNVTLAFNGFSFAATAINFIDHFPITMRFRPIFFASNNIGADWSVLINQTAVGPFQLAFGYASPFIGAGQFTNQVQNYIQFNLGLGANFPAILYSQISDSWVAYDADLY